MAGFSHSYNPRPPFARLMRGRPDEPDSHQHIAVYSREEFNEYRAKGWKPAHEFLASVERAQRKDN